MKAGRKRNHVPLPFSLILDRGLSFGWGLVCPADTEFVVWLMMGAHPLSAAGGLSLARRFLCPAGVAFFAPLEFGPPPARAGGGLWGCAPSSAPLQHTGAPPPSFPTLSFREGCAAFAAGASLAMLAQARVISLRAAQCHPLTVVEKEMLSRWMLIRGA